MLTLTDIKNHLDENKKVYIGLAIGVVVGVVITKRVEISNAVKIQGLVNINPTINNEFISVINPRHSRSIAVRNPITGEIFGSIRHASDLTGLSREVA